MDELEARIRALSRRAPRAISRVLTFGPLSFDEGKRQAFAGSEMLDLPRRELALFEAFLRVQGIIPKQTLLDALYGTGADIGESAVEVNVSRLRKKLANFGVDIRVRRGLGYELLQRAKGK